MKYTKNTSKVHQAMTTILLYGTLRKGVSMLKILFDGICMSAADSIPGVSGSTVAFILGFYDEFITSLHNCVNKDKTLRNKAIIYILKLLPGWTIGMVLSVLILASVIENYCYLLSSIFMGLTIASIPFLIIQEKNILSQKYRHIVFVFLGIAASVAMYFIRDLFAIEVINFHMLSRSQYIYIFIVCAVGMAIMLLPGISGSAFLLVCGVYTPFITAAKDLLYLDFSVLPGIAVGCAGMLTGSVLSIKSVKEFIEKHRGAAMYLILGFILGSLYAIIQAPSIRENPLPPLSFATFSISGFIGGAASLTLLELIKFRNDRCKAKKQ